MGFKDKVRQGADVARTRFDESREATAARTEHARIAQAAREAEAAGVERERLERRQHRFDEVQRICPLPIQVEEVALTGGLTLFEDEFLVTVGRDWGWSSQKLLLTTHRVVYSRGRALTAKDQEVVYLTDIRDVRFHKPLVGFGTLALETAGAGSIEGLPAARNGAEIRNRLLALIHFARTQAQTQTSSSVAAPIESGGEDIAAKLKQLGELRDGSVITAEEFEAKKAELLTRL